MLVPTLTTSRIKLRPFTPEDAVAFQRILAEPGVLQFFPESEPPSLDRVQRLIDRLINHWENYGYGVWALELLTTGELIGRCGLFYIANTDETEVDYILAKEQWGKGIATEVAKVALHFGFNHAQKETIVGIVHPGNLASQHVLEKIGMTFTRADNYFGMDCLRYAILRSEFAHIQATPP